MGAAGRRERIEASTAYLWFDTEYSSLTLEKARLLQVAMVITDAQLRRMTPPAEDFNAFIRLEEGVPVSPWVLENMPNLVQRCRSPEAMTVEQVDRRLAAWIDRTVVVPLGDEKKKPILAGNSIHADWYLLQKFLPATLKRLHYRHLDVTTLKLQWQDYAAGEKFDKDDVALLRRYFPDLVVPADAKAHDAYYDCQASIAELAFYRKHLFKRRVASRS